MDAQCTQRRKKCEKIHNINRFRDINLKFIQMFDNDIIHILAKMLKKRYREFLISRIDNFQESGIPDKIVFNCG